MSRIGLGETLTRGEGEQVYDRSEMPSPVEYAKDSTLDFVEHGQPPVNSPVVEVTNVEGKR